jgi:transcriptional regulator with XRE-family HTH domain
MQTLSFSPDRLREAREHLGLSQAGAAKAADVSRATIQNAESGRNMPQADVLARMAQVYGVSLDSLFVHGENADTSLDPCGKTTSPGLPSTAAVPGSLIKEPSR